MTSPNSVYLFPSTRCDRGCRHCLNDSTIKGDDMTVDTVMEVIDWIRRSKNPKQRRPEVGLTGGGEPLLNSKLSEIIGALVDAKCNDGKISIVTSGCLPGTDEAEMFKEIFDKYGKHLTPYLSFHLFQPSFPKRLEHTLKILLACENTTYINIKMTVFDNSFRAHRALGAIFERLRISYCAGTTAESLRHIGKSEVLQQAIRQMDRKNEIPYLFATLVDSVHFTTDKTIVVRPQALSKNGRGAVFYSRTHTDFCALFDQYRQWLTVTIHPNGKILPSEDSRCLTQNPLFIGNIHEHDFKGLLRRRKAAQKILRGLMANGSQSPPCQLCQAEMLRHGLIS